MSKTYFRTKRKPLKHPRGIDEESQTKLTTSDTAAHGTRKQKKLYKKVMED